MQIIKLDLSEQAIHPYGVTSGCWHSIYVKIPCRWAKVKIDGMKAHLI